MRHRHTSSGSSSSPDSRRHHSNKSSSKNTTTTSSKYSKSRTRSKSNSPSRHKRRNRRHESSDSDSGSDHRSKYSSSKKSSNSSSSKYAKSRRSRSRSSSSDSRHGSKKQTADKHSRLLNLEKEERTNQRFEFKEDMDVMFKGDRSKEIRKIDDEGGGFKPQAFKSSRSSKFKQSEDTSYSSTITKKETEHENAMFGPRPMGQRETIVVEKKANDESSSANNALTPTTTVSSSNVSTKVVTNNSVMHDRLFEDIAVREERWRLKMLDLLKRSEKQQQTVN